MINRINKKIEEICRKNDSLGVEEDLYLFLDFLKNNNIPHYIEKTNDCFDIFMIVDSDLKRLKEQESNIESFSEIYDFFKKHNHNEKIQPMFKKAMCFYEIAKEK